MSVTLHTNLGDLKVELFCEDAPRTCENFLALCASEYYDNTSFHRNIKGFMIQGGDPTGTGRGGQSIWGGKFNDVAIGAAPFVIAMLAMILILIWAPFLATWLPTLVYH